MKSAVTVNHEEDFKGYEGALVAAALFRRTNAMRVSHLWKPVSRESGLMTAARYGQANQYAKRART